LNLFKGTRATACEAKSQNHRIREITKSRSPQI
jgi:hypothetical protein